MSNNTQAARAASKKVTSGNNHNATPRTAEFFKLWAQYNIAPNQASHHLACDATCILSSAASIINTVIQGIEDKEAQGALFGAYYLIQMAESITGELEIAE
jgi:hypothetical protein